MLDRSNRTVVGQTSGNSINRALIAGSSYSVGDDNCANILTLLACRLELISPPVGHQRQEEAAILDHERPDKRQLFHDMVVQ